LHYASVQGFCPRFSREYVLRGKDEYLDIGFRVALFMELAGATLCERHACAGSRAFEYCVGYFCHLFDLAQRFSRQ
jgi:hypothetical protein